MLVYIYSMKRIWFRPFKMGYVAAYYPVRWQGWIITLMVLTSAIAIFSRIDAASHSASDTFFGSAPYFIALGAFFDLCTRAFGEYPWWWKRKVKSKK